MSAEIREDVLKLIHRKDRIEAEIKHFTGILTKNGVGMDDPLVDPEGFPIYTIDVYQVRNARHRIICLQNDHKAVMKEIEEGLGGYYSSSAQEGRSNTFADVKMHQVAPFVIQETPFAKVTMVGGGSPADNAGISEDDLIVEFGSLNATNFKNITDIATVIQHSEEKQINVKLLRSGRYIEVSLIPKKWFGKGLLGCNVVPLNI